MTNSTAPKTREALINVLDELSEERMVEILDFALFLKERQSKEGNPMWPRPVEQMEDLWGDFWPKDESVDDFVEAVRRWRSEDMALHKDLQ